MTDGEPAGEAPPFDDRPTELEIQIPKLMRVGLLLAMALTAVGLALRVAAGPTPDGTLSLAALPEALLRLRPEAVMGVGLLILIFTPILRVVASAAYFARIKDRPYVALTLLVLVNLALAAALGAL